MLSSDPQQTLSTLTLRTEGILAQLTRQAQAIQSIAETDRRESSALPLGIDKVLKTIIISDMGPTEKIRQAIASKPLGAVFSSTDFLSAGSRAAVDQTLYRLMKGGAIARVARGLYVVSGQIVEAHTVATAVAYKTGEQLGFMPSDGLSNVTVVPTSGLSRTLKAAGHTLQFRRMSQRKVQLAANPKGQVLLALWTRGHKNLTTIEIKRAIADWSQVDIDAFAALIPAWLRTAIAQVLTPRKSVLIGLSGAYDWSNPHIKDEVLITKVLEKYKFEDVARLCFYFGVPKVKRVFKQGEFGAVTRASLTRMLCNISKGLRATVIPAYA